MTSLQHGAISQKQNKKLFVIWTFCLWIHFAIRPYVDLLLRVTQMFSSLVFMAMNLRNTFLLDDFLLKCKTLTRKTSVKSYNSFYSELQMCIVDFLMFTIQLSSLWALILEKSNPQIVEMNFQVEGVFIGIDDLKPLKISGNLTNLQK